jgi:hypothetical protein
MDYITLATNALILFVLQMMLACVFNMVNNIKVPTNNIEFILLTFLPYTIYSAWDKMLASEKINEEILDNIW